MFTVFECVVGQHDLRLVVLAALVWLLGSFTLFLLLERSTDCVETRRQFWLATAAVSAGIGVWTTHFIAMLAYDGPLPLSFEPGRTVASAVLAILFFWATLKVAGRQFGIRSSMAAGALAAGGVTAMHFTGMAAIVAPATTRYDWSMIVPALVVISAAFTAAFFSFGRLKGHARIAVPALLAVLGVLALHYTAMSATLLVPDPLKSVDVGTEANTWLVPVIVAAALGLIASALAGAFLDRMLTDLRGIADATLEGLAIISGGRIVEANSRLAKLLGCSQAELIGTDPAQWLKPSDGHPLGSVRDRPAEAVIRHASGKELVIEIAPHAVEYRGRSCEVLAVRDLTDRKRAERQIEHLAAHDALTGLPNRTQLSTVLEDLTRNHNAFALLALDLDRFKVVNDTFGHAAGDQVLCRVAGLLTRTTRETDLVARVGGDEFLIIQQGVNEVTAARQLTQRILDTFAQEMDTTQDPLAVGVSIGVALFPRDARSGADLRHHADVALYQAKEAGRGVACFFDQDMDRHVRKRRELEHELRHAIARDEFRLVFQPIVATATSRVIGYEALLRWQHPVHGAIPPQTFIPIAEDVGTIVQIGEWVLRRACEIAARWPEHLSIAVNVSAVQFELPGLGEMVEAALRDSGLSPHRLELEVTESVMLRNRVIALATLRRLKRRGVAIVMDDFGTGYSSLSNLQAFPFDKIKIDRSFVASMEHDEAARSIIRAIVGLGQSLMLPIVAEGVETDAQHRLVLEAGCAQAQGYLFGVPSETVPTGPQLYAVGGRSH